MDLLEQLGGQPHNLLPYDGTVYYFGPVITGNEADRQLEQLLQQIAWQHDRVNIMGRERVTSRKVAWYGDRPFLYRYSNSSKIALPWTSTLLELKSLVERESGESFNSCLLNLYQDGRQAMGWHSDAEKELKPQGAIASLSLGAPRRFGFKHKTTKESYYQLLEHGSLLVMKGITQRRWLHRLPPQAGVLQPRVNLTFRTIVT